MKRIRHRLALLAFGLVLAGSAAGQVTITLSGKAESTALGWNQNDVVTMTVTVTNGFVTGNNSFTGSFNRWIRTTTSHDVLYSAVTLTGTTGDYTEPETTSADPSSDIFNDSNGDTLRMTIGADTSTIGLNTPAPDNQGITYLQAYNLDPGVNFSFPGTFTDPVEYLSAYVGSYTLQGGYIYLEVGHGSENIQFDTTGYTLTISAVPEPATWALFAGLAGLAGAIWHGRRMRS